jgi:mono/diheme cytochrome c family protein
MSENRPSPAASDGLGDTRGQPEPGQHDLTTDVEHIHRPILREASDPVEGQERAPWWLWAIVAVALFWGGWYLGRHGGTFSAAAHLDFPTGDVVGAGATPPPGPADDDPVQAGQRVYTQRCQACHQADGRGLAGTFPPVVGSEWEVGPPETPVRIVNGLHQPIEVAGETYDGVMPAWGGILSDAEISAVVTFIRQWDTNDAGPVEPQLVESLRAESASRVDPWTAEELLQLVPASGENGEPAPSPAPSPEP